MAAPADSEKVKVLKIAIEELRRVHDHISNGYDQLRIKALAMIAAEVALAAFIFSDGKSSPVIPPIPSGVVFFFAGVACLLAAFALLLSALTAGTWPVPGDMDEIEQIDNGIDNRYDTVEKFLFFLRRDYLEGNRQCMKIVATRARRVNYGLYILLAGAIILLVIKFGGAQR